MPIDANTLESNFKLEEFAFKYLDQAVLFVD